MTVGQMLVIDAANFEYLSTTSTYYDWLSSSGGSSVEITAKGLYLAALTAPPRIKDSTMDLWDNVKIPMLEDLPGWIEDGRTSDDWYEVPVQNVSYASLVGIPVSGLAFDAGTAKLNNLETSYWKLDCPIVQRGGVCDLLGADTFAKDSSTPAYNFSIPSSLTPACNRTDWSGNTASMSAKIYGNSSGPRGTGRECAANQTQVSPRQIIYSGYPTYFTGEESDNDQSSAFCTITTSWIEVEVHCPDLGCTVLRARRSQLEHPPPGWTTLDDTYCVNYNYFVSCFLRVDDASSSAQGALPQGYLAYPSDPSLAIHGAVEAPYPADLSPSLFARRLAQLLNTWWVVSVGREVISSGVDMGKVGRGGDDLSIQERLELSNASGTLSHEVAVIQCRMGWFVALTVVSAVLIAASALPLILRIWTHAPAFNLLLSTMLKDSAYFEGPDTGSSLESPDRSRLLRHRKVRLGDVAPDDAVGYLAVGSLDDGGDGVGQVGRVQRERLYR